MRKLLFLALGAILFTQFACKGGSGDTTKHGHRFVNHTEKSGPKCNYGDVVEVNVNTWLNDSLVQSTARDMGGPQVLTLPDTAAFKNKAKFPALFDVLFEMTEGDSSTVWQVVDSTMKAGITRAFPGMDVKEIRYEVVLVNQFSKEELAEKEAKEKAKMEAQQAGAEALRGRAIEVSNLMTKSLADYKGKKLANVQKTDSGLEYVILDKGTGAPVKDGQEIPTLYYGVFQADGKMFDNAFDRGQALPFRVGQMIPGFNEGMKLLNRGGKAILFIPYALGYGEQGTPNGIPPKSNLMFYVELEQ